MYISFNMWRVQNRVESRITNYTKETAACLYITHIIAHIITLGDCLATLVSVHTSAVLNSKTGRQYR